MEERINNLLRQYFGRDLHDSTKEEIFEVLMQITKEEMENRPRITGKKKLYYISAEFLMGKLLSNNLINLGMYDEIDQILKKYKLEIPDIEELELEPSLGNGGLGRLAACFLDSIATLGLYGDGVGLNYHYGLFRQEFVNHKQHELINPWIRKQSWLERRPVSFEVPFRRFTLHSCMYDIDVPGYMNGKCNRLHLFDLDSVDDQIVKENSIDFDKDDIPRNLTLFLYP
ncbi:MAG: glycogen/starch/alpha-glucan phosphorylase, partial [Lachnospiraceae bacterium]|nr:glycogen/starch/alpha-glucan phosphorylase [Lachnospiraceae bacterium]